MQHESEWRETPLSTGRGQSGGPVLQGISGAKQYGRNLRKNLAQDSWSKNLYVQWLLRQSLLSDLHRQEYVQPEAAETPFKGRTPFMEQGPWLSEGRLPGCLSQSRAAGPRTTATDRAFVGSHAGKGPLLSEQMVVGICRLFRWQPAFFIYKRDWMTELSAGICCCCVLRKQLWGGSGGGK